ncbi:hypothetical protein [Hydrogenimonas sp.]
MKHVHKNKSDINNPNNDAYWKARGYPVRPNNWRELVAKDSSPQSFSDVNNPNNDAYWRMKGYNGRPKNWRERISEKKLSSLRGPYSGGYDWPMYKDDY